VDEDVLSWLTSCGSMTCIQEEDWTVVMSWQTHRQASIPGHTWTVVRRQEKHRHRWSITDRHWTAARNDSRK